MERSADADGAETLEAALIAFLSYAPASSLCSMPAGLLQRLPELRTRAAAVEAAFAANGEFLRRMLEDLGLVHMDAQQRSSPLLDELHGESCPHEQPQPPPPPPQPQPQHQPPPQPQPQHQPLSPPPQQRLVYGVLAQLRREWSDAGAAEREQSFGVIERALRRHCPPADGAAAPPRCLVPGAGLGRLPLELAAGGYDAVGVEDSYFMLVPSRYVLERLLPSGQQADIFPYAHELSNVSEAAHLSRPVSVPGQVAAAEGTQARPRTIAGRLESLSGLAAHAGAWDAVACCFFLDACGDVCAALEHVRTVLRDGGVWVSLGPLHYHGDAATAGAGGRDAEGPPRLCADELLLLISRSGFELLESSVAPCSYAQDPLSMCRCSFEALFFVARKVGGHGVT